MRVSSRDLRMLRDAVQRSADNGNPYETYICTEARDLAGPTFKLSVADLMRSAGLEDFSGNFSHSGVPIHEVDRCRLLFLDFLILFAEDEEAGFRT